MLPITPVAGVFKLCLPIPHWAGPFCSESSKGAVLQLLILAPSISIMVLSSVNLLLVVDGSTQSHSCFPGNGDSFGGRVVFKH